MMVNNFKLVSAFFLLLLVVNTSPTFKTAKMIAIDDAPFQTSCVYIMTWKGNSSTHATSYILCVKIGSNCFTNFIPKAS